MIIAIHREIKLFAREWGERNGPRKFFVVIAQNAKEINYIAINVMISCHRRWIAIEQYSRRAAKRFPIGVACRQ